MSTNANVLVIGKFKDVPDEILDYPPDHYYDVKEAIYETLIVAHIGECASKEQSLKFAEILGVDCYEFATHHITKLPILLLRPVAGTYDEDLIHWYTLVQQCLQRNCIVIFQPNY